MDSISSNYEIQNKRLFILFCSFFIVLLAGHFSLPIILNKPVSEFYRDGPFYYIDTTVYFLELLLSVEMELSYFRKGFKAQLIFNIIMFAGSLAELILSSDLYSAKGLLFPVLIQLICYFVLSKLNKLNQNFDELNRIAFSDDLTGLINRKKVVSSISNLIDQGKKFSIMFIDMDNFKIINDSLGHQVGNIFLNEVVHNIERIVDPNMIFGRMGGDEFLVIVPYESDRDSLSRFADDVNKVVSMPFLYKNRSYIVTCSTGISSFPDDGESTMDLLRHADMALYRAKGLGKKQAVFYSQEIQNEFDRKLKMEYELHTAIENDELYLVFQPQFAAFNSRKKRVRGYEALARWKSPSFGEVQPSTFIRLAEENGDILPLGRWIMKKAFLFYLQMRREHKIDADAMLALNISFIQFRNPLFIEEIKELLKDTGMPAERIELEITEYVCVHAPETTIERLKELSNMGIKIALDDFGTGYASISFLRALPFNSVKIDKSFIDTIGKIPDHENIVESVINLAHQLHLVVVAEGVETKQECDDLIRWGCDYLQGFYLSKPIDSQLDLFNESGTDGVPEIQSI